MTRFGRRHGFGREVVPLRCAALVVAVVGVGVAALIRRPDLTDPVFAAPAGVALLAAFRVWRSSRYGVFVDDRGIKLVRHWGRERIPWSQVADIGINKNLISLRDPGNESWIIQLRLNGGEFRLTPLQVESRKPEDRLRIEEAVADLRRWHLGAAPMR